MTEHDAFGRIDRRNGIRLSIADLNHFDTFILFKCSAVTCFAVIEHLNARNTQYGNFAFPADGLC